MTDEELVLAAQNGDNSAFEELYKKYKPIILSVARKFFLCGGDVEDLVQEGTCGLYSAVRKFKAGKNGFSAYASVCIHNRIIDVIKKSNGAKYSALNNFLPIFEIGEFGYYESPEDKMIGEEAKAELLEKMQEVLSPLEHKALRLYIDGLTISEISQSLGKNPKSVDNAINRAKNKLQEILSE